MSKKNRGRIDGAITKPTMLESERIGLWHTEATHAGNIAINASMDEGTANLKKKPPGVVGGQYYTELRERMGSPSVIGGQFYTELNHAVTRETKTSSDNVTLNNSSMSAARKETLVAHADIVTRAFGSNKIGSLHTTQ